MTSLLLLTIVTAVRIPADVLAQGSPTLILAICLLWWIFLNGAFDGSILKHWHVWKVFVLCHIIHFCVTKGMFSTKLKD